MDRSRARPGWPGFLLQCHLVGWPGFLLQRHLVGVQGNCEWRCSCSEQISKILLTGAFDTFGMNSFMILKMLKEKISTLRVYIIILNWHVAGGIIIYY